MRCSIVIPTFNGGPFTEACVDRILAYPPAVPYEIVVVDDASSDGSGEALARHFSDRTPAGQEGPLVRVLHQGHNGGFAEACNEGAREARGEWIVFLNNDTLPEPGWLDALVAHAHAHPEAHVVGCLLVYPEGSVQHAGVAFGQDGFPRHVYAGFPSDHPAVMRPRALQAVTAACLLIARERFLDLGGFDLAFRNGMEDVDLCLRVGEAGGEVHYCPSARVVHLESLTRGRDSAEIREGIRLFEERWGSRVRADDLDIYQSDGLLEIRYGSGHPLQLFVAPELAVVRAGEEGAQGARLLERSRQASDLLHDLIELSVWSGFPAAWGLRSRWPQTPPHQLPEAGGEDRVERALTRAFKALDELQLELVEAGAASGVLPTPRLDYRVRTTEYVEWLEAHLPAEARVAVVSHGDDRLLEVGGRYAVHFPAASDGSYAGHHPADSEEAIARLEELRAQGVTHLVIPADSAWWLEHYTGLAAHLQAHSVKLPVQAGGFVFELEFVFTPETEEAHVVAD